MVCVAVWLVWDFLAFWVLWGWNNTVCFCGLWVWICCVLRVLVVVLTLILGYLIRFLVMQVVVLDPSLP